MGRYRIDIEHLAYEQASHDVLHDIHLELSFDDVTLIAGKSGCGKTTLLKMLKKQLRTSMRMEGTILWEDQHSISIEDMDDLESAFQIGYVSQQPDVQLVSDQVWHELAFGLENMGLDRECIHHRIAETVAYLGLEEIYHTPLNELSGGQKQIINLAGVIAMRPKVILLDEPTSQLDPVAKQKFYDLLIRLHENFGIGIIMVEHSLESLLDVSDHVIYLDQGSVAYDGAADQLCQCLLPYPSLLPFPARFVAEKRRELKQNPVCDKEMRSIMKSSTIQPGNRQAVSFPDILSCEHVYFRYVKDQSDILRDMSLHLKQHEILCLFGGNGSGKTTFLKMLGSRHVKSFGKVKIEKRLVYLPQDPRALFIRDSLREEYLQYADDKQMQAIIQQFQLQQLLDMHPYDISGGELQRAALALLLLQAKEEVIFLLDEPSKGLDMYYREELAKVFQELAKQHTILMVSHDVEFASLCADRCGFLFDGRLTSLQPTREFFLDNAFYTTYWRRITINQEPCAICYEEILS